MIPPSKEEVEQNFELLRKELEHKTEPEEEGAPEWVRIPSGGLQGCTVGATADGRQFFLTPLFIGQLKENPGNEFEALFLFDGDGTLDEAEVVELGPRATLDLEFARKWDEERLLEIGPVVYRDIYVKPFAVERFGVMMGLIPFRHDESDHWTVEIHPGNFMAFYPPWDSGRYDT